MMCYIGSAKNTHIDCHMNVCWLLVNAGPEISGLFVFCPVATLGSRLQESRQSG